MSQPNKITRRDLIHSMAGVAITATLGVLSSEQGATAADEGADRQPSHSFQDGRAVGASETPTPQDIYNDELTQVVRQSKELEANKLASGESLRGLTVHDMQEINPGNINSEPPEHAVEYDLPDTRDLYFYGTDYFNSETAIPTGLMVFARNEQDQVFSGVMDGDALQMMDVSGKWQIWFEQVKDREAINAVLDEQAPEPQEPFVPYTLGAIHIQKNPTTNSIISCKAEPTPDMSSLVMGEQTIVKNLIGGGSIDVNVNGGQVSNIFDTQLDNSPAQTTATAGKAVWIRGSGEFELIVRPQDRSKQIIFHDPVTHPVVGYDQVTQNFFAVRKKEWIRVQEPDHLIEGWNAQYVWQLSNPGQGTDFHDVMMNIATDNGNFVETIIDPAESLQSIDPESNLGPLSPEQILARAKDLQSFTANLRVEVGPNTCIKPELFQTGEDMVQMPPIVDLTCTIHVDEDTVGDRLRLVVEIDPTCESFVVDLPILDDQDVTPTLTVTRTAEPTRSATPTPRPSATPTSLPTTFIRSILLPLLFR